MLNNSDYATAYTSAKNATSSQLRIELYTQALAQAQTPSEEGDIKNKLATEYSISGDYMRALDISKDVATNTSYPAIERAYAIQFMADLFYLYHDPQITEQIFSAEPFKSLQVQGDTETSYRHLYEYASSFFPLPISEARIADFYADDLMTLYYASSTDETEMAQDRVAISQHLANFDRISSQANSVFNTQFQTGAYLRYAIVIGKLARVGDKTGAEAEAAFQEASRMSILITGADDPFIYYHYADFLTHMYPYQRVTDIETMLAKIYNGNYGPQTPIVSFLKNERMNVTGVKSNVARLARIDPQFKAYLETLGWQEQAGDFAK